MKNKEKYSNYNVGSAFEKFREQHQSCSPTLEDFSKWLNEEYKEPKILDDAERRYLRNVILPFYNHVRRITKLSNISRKCEYICIELGEESVMLPYFTAGTMYKNMELRKEYTLKELDIRK